MKIRLTKALPLVLLTVFAVNGCASLSETGGRIGQSLSKIELPTLGRDSTPDTFANYPQDQVPHTLLTKPVAEGRLTSTFGYRRNPTGFRLMPKRHKGIDYGAPAGTPVFAAGNGTVDKIYVSDSYGKYIRITHANGFQSAYAHLTAFTEGLSVGDHVTKGQQIGAVGSTGRSTSNHLHYELLHEGQQVDPLFASR